MIDLEDGGQIDVRRVGEMYVALEFVAIKRNPVTRTCSKCGALPGHPCRSRTGRADGALHSSRCGDVPVEVITRSDALALMHELEQLVR
jgi:hypothetical protein